MTELPITGFRGPVQIEGKLYVVTQPVRWGAATMTVREATRTDRARWVALRAWRALSEPVRAWWADLEWVRPALAQRCAHDGNWVLPRWRKWWMTWKVVSALVLHHEGDAGSDYVEVAMGPVTRTYSMEFGEGGEFESLAVPYRGWCYEVKSDGWP